jgi:hypothetical protein
MMWNNLINDILIPFLASPLNSGTSYNTGFDKKFTYVGQVVILPFCAGCHIGRHVEYHVLGSFGLFSLVPLNCRASKHREIHQICLYRSIYKFWFPGGHLGRHDGSGGNIFGNSIFLHFYHVSTLLCVKTGSCVLPETY